MSSLRVPLLALLCGALCAFPALAQEKTFGETIDVIEVQVPVRVLRKGEPVRGLTASDFEVYAGGERQEIIAFEAIDLTASPGSGAADAQAPRRNVLIVLERLMSRYWDLERALQGLRRMVGQDLRPGDRVGFAFTAPEGVEIVSELTDDATRIRSGLEALARRVDASSRDMMRSGASSIELDLQAYSSRSGVLGGPANAPPSANRIMGDAAALALRTLPRLDGHRVPQSSGFAMSGMAYLSGREAGTTPVPGPGGSLIISGGGSSRFVGPDVISNPTSVAALQSTMRDITTDRMRGFFQELATRLSFSLADLVTLLRDVEGSNHVILVGGGFRERALISQSVYRGLVLEMRKAFARYGWTLHTVDLTSDRVGGLYIMARQTGGEALEGFNQVDQAIARIQHKTSVSYVLTVRAPKARHEGRYRRLKVRLKDGRGARLVHRTGYVDPGSSDSPLARTLDVMEAILGDEERRELPLEVLAPAPPVALDGKLSRVPVVLALDLSALPRDAGKLDLELYAYAFDAAGGALAHLVQPLALSLGRLDADQRVLHVVGGLELPRGEHRLRLAVRAPKSERMTLFTLPLEVAAEPLAGPHLLSPVFVAADPAEIIAVRAAGSELAKDPNGPFTLDGELFLPAVEPILAPGESAGFIVHGYAVAGPRIAISSGVLSHDGTPAPGGRVEILSRTDAGNRAQKLVGRLDAAGLPPGRYRLEIGAHDVTTGATSTGVGTFRVVASE